MYYCSICKGTDHPSRYCPDDRDEEEEIVQPIPCRTVAQNDLKLAPIVCSLCGQTGHPSRLCQSTNDFAKRRATEAMNRELASDHCTLCKQTDHTSRSCPNASDLAKKCATGNLIYRACFNCGEFGHFSRDCTAPAGQNKGKENPNVSCYNCGEMGHMSRECPEPRQDYNRKCHICKDPGHLSNACREKYEK